MKPLSITISAFGPFAERTEIELSKFGNKGIYLITGDTGAGKTTVFDAICFALFGEASGKYRTKAASYRCVYATPDTPTYVHLVFEHNGEVYSITRNPEYSRPKNKGEGFTTEVAKAELKFPDGRVVTKVSDVTHAVEDLIGLNHDQFTQISMLAQGDFQRLLNADTKERIEIFRKIFNTHLYQLFQDKVGEKQSVLNKDWNEQKRAIAQLIESVDCENDTQKVAIDELKDNAVYMTDEVCSKIAEMVESDAIKIKSFDDEIVGITKDLEKLAAEIEKVTEFSQMNVDLKNQQRIKIDFDSKIRDVNEKLNNHISSKSEREKQANVGAVVSSQLEQYSALDALLTEGKQVKSEIVDINKKSDEVLTKCEQLVKELDNCRKEVLTLDDVQQTYVQTELKFESAKQKKKMLEELADLIFELNKATENHNVFLSKYQDISNVYRAARDEYASLEDLFLNGQAGLLANRLENGKPCPVCGSVEHPSPAVNNNEIPDQSVIKDKKEKLDDLQQKVQSLANESQKLMGICDTLKQKTTEKANVILGTDDDYENAVKLQIFNVDTEINELQKELVVLKQKADRREELNKIIPQLESSVSELTALAAEFSKKLAICEERRSQLLTRYTEISSGLEYKSRDEAITVIDKADKYVDWWDKTLSQLQSESDEISKQINAVVVRINLLEEKLKDAPDVDIESLHEKRRNTEISLNNLRLNREDVVIRKSNNQTVVNSIKSRAKQLDELAERLKVMNAINDTASGRISGKDKVGFETYVQIKWFDRIVNMASQRFSAMTNGQYSLIRKTLAENRTSQSGLELDVIDHRSGTSRSVKTLSGGESFKASLSLALGLSDVVQAVSGGIHLDAMYIDEGFGSLDEESLSQAVKALYQLTDGNRIVGIISHVAELKERFDKQLVIKKDDNGISRVRIDA